ncbi:MAG: hypothetical protein ACKVUT_11885, partial [Gaiella sp.]
MRGVDVNPFPIAGALADDEVIGRDRDVVRLLQLAKGGHAARLVAPRRYGKTTVLRRLLGDAERGGMVSALVDLEGVLSLSSLVVRIERAYEHGVKGPLRKTVDSLLRSWQIGLSLGGGGFAATLRSNPRVDVEAVLLRLLELPVRVHERTKARTLVAFDEVQDLLRIEGADGILRSVIQHQTEVASYVFAGSSPSLVERLFEDPSRPLLDHAVPIALGPLPLDEVADAVERRFRVTRRAVGGALDPLVQLTRGHPQRTMLLAHELWELIPRGATADEEALWEARARALTGAEGSLRARWESLPVNEQRVALALATRSGGLYAEETLAPLGLKRGSVDRALAGLVGRGDAIRTQAGPTLT